MRIFGFFLISLLLLSAKGFSQQKTASTPKRNFTMVDSIMMYPDQAAIFPGGMDGLTKFLGANLQYPEAAQKKKIEGQVLARIVVHSNGKVSDVEILSALGYGCDEEVIRVLSKLPKFTPAISKGKNVPSYFLFPVTFSLDGKEKQE